MVRTVKAKQTKQSSIKRQNFSSSRQISTSLWHVTTPLTMKSILLASKPSNNNQLSVGTQIRRNESSPTIHHHHHYHLNNTNAAAESAASEQIEKEHYNKLFTNSKKQVIRSRCSVDKLKRVSSSDSKSECLVKVKSSESDYLENRPLIGESKSFSVESENHKAVKLINLRKKNGTTLIFQRKSKQKANEYRELESLKKRRSLQQWPNAGSTNVSLTNANRHSWYDPDYYPRAIEEEFDDFDVSIERDVIMCVVLIVMALLFCFCCLCKPH